MNKKKKGELLWTIILGKPFDEFLEVKDSLEDKEIRKIQRKYGQYYLKCLSLLLNKTEYNYVIRWLKRDWEENGSFLIFVDECLGETIQDWRDIPPPNRSKRRIREILHKLNIQPNW